MLKLPISVTLLILSMNVAATPKQIVLMRHAEKPEQNQGAELSEQGWARARALPQLFHSASELQPYGTPVALYAMAPNKPGGSVRAIQTLLYVSQDLKLPVQAQFTRDQNSDLAKQILNDPALDGKMVVVCWEHQALIDLAQALGVATPHSWPAAQFDRYWLLTYSNQGTLAQYQDLPEHLMPGDSAN